MHEQKNDHVLTRGRTVINKFKEDMIDFVLKGSKEEVCGNLLSTDKKDNLCSKGSAHDTLGPIE